VGPRAVLDSVVKRKILSSRQESNPRTPIVHPVAQSLYRLNYPNSTKAYGVTIPYYLFKHFISWKFKLLSQNIEMGYIHYIYMNEILIKFGG
jgi:hypothetical protein